MKFFCDPIFFIVQLPTEPVVTHVMEAPELYKWFEQATEVGNPDALLLALKLHEKVSVDHPIFSKLLPVPFSSGKFFSADHLTAIGNCLKVQRKPIFLLCRMVEHVKILSADCYEFVTY